ncbi:hypothetical protein WP8S18E11_03480 [Aeromonas veronii]|nr:hypothetical protein WP8S18E11_03480 [Aeromonas veronii]
MLDHEIIDVASDLFSKIQSSLNMTTYKNLSGELSFYWGTKDYFSAWAEVHSTPQEPPKHSIGITYRTAILLYRDIEKYHKYIEDGIDKPTFEKLLEGIDIPKSLAIESSLENSCKNMFVSGMTWIFFHELGHLLQEHGWIRQRYDCSPSTDVIDCASQDTGSETLLTGKASAVSHVTEMAADFFATITCLGSLMLHLKGLAFNEELGKFSAVLSLVLYRFHGPRPYNPMEVPTGTHPVPLNRLEQTQPLIFEYLSAANLSNTVASELTRLDMIHITTWASYTTGFFWLRENNTFKLPENYFLSGSLQRPSMTAYHRHMVNIWDEIKPEIDTVKRISDPSTELQFSDQYRELLFKH